MLPINRIRDSACPEDLRGYIEKEKSHSKFVKEPGIDTESAES